MGINEILVICIMCTVGVVLYALGIFMLCGYGGMLVAGYHYEPKTERAKKYHKKVMRIIGCWYLALVTIIFVSIICAIFSQKVLAIVSGVLIVVVLIAMLLHLNCSPKVRELLIKERDDYSEEVRYHQSEDNIEYHESKDNIEYHESKDDIQYHNCDNDKLANYKQNKEKSDIINSTTLEKNTKNKD